MEDDAIVDAWRLIVAAHDRVGKELADELKHEFDLTIPHSDALLRLSLSPDHRLRMTDLAQMMLYSSGAATKIVDRLVERDQVRRYHDRADARGVWVELTESGLDLITRARQAHRLAIVRVLGPFESDAESEHVIAYLNRLAQIPQWP